jgi:hypothetical protein
MLWKPIVSGVSRACLMVFRTTTSPANLVFTEVWNTWVVWLQELMVSSFSYIVLMANIPHDWPTSPIAPLSKHLQSQNVEFMQFAFRWMNCLLMRELSVKNIIRMWDTYLVRVILASYKALGILATSFANRIIHSPKVRMRSRNSIFTYVVRSWRPGVKSCARWTFRSGSFIFEFLSYSSFI